MAAMSTSNGRLDPRTPEEAKEALRAAIRTRRSKRSERINQGHGNSFVKVALSIPAVQHAGCVTLFVNRPTEPPTVELIDALAARGVRVLLPKLGAGLARDWGAYRDRGDLQVRAPHRPPEPSGDDLGSGAVADADVALIPALAVDTTGARLGQGGGWYDRAMQHLRPGVPVFAVVFDDELLDAQASPLPVLPHDQPVDGVITPSGWRWLRRASAVDAD